MKSGMRVIVAAASLLFAVFPLFAGPLNPPAGPVAPTPGPEPRIAVNAANTPGDNDATPSLFKITQPGSYYLQGNISGETQKHGIEIAASGVTLDLNGFDVACAPGARGLDGVIVTVADLSDIAVFNGSVRGWGGDGVDLGSANAKGGRVEGVRASDNSSVGIWVGAGSVVSACTATANGSAGIRTAFNCTVGRCAASTNAGDGIDGNIVNTVTDCTAYQNGTDGVTAGIGSKITNCTGYDNTGRGISIGSSGLVEASVAEGNGGSGIYPFFGAAAINCKSDLNTLHGIETNDRCRVVGNSCVRNGAQGVGSGIQVNGNDCRIEGNSCIEADRGIEINGTGNVVIRNTCAGNSTANWDIDANNVCGPILNRSAPASAAILGDSAASSLGTTDANANITH